MAWRHICWFVPYAFMRSDWIAACQSSAVLETLNTQLWKLIDQCYLKALLGYIDDNIHTYIYAYMYVLFCRYRCRYACNPYSARAYRNTNTCIYICIFRYMYMYICTCICMCIYVYVHAYRYVRTHNGDANFEACVPLQLLIDILGLSSCPWWRTLARSGTWWGMSHFRTMPQIRNLSKDRLHQFLL